ncbi:hypothetical protein CANTEDRAFT_115664 [Yamadazyma tenuis ATCC 10573]|uniref:Uncharacterized protein n=1 Tax=Candida tenuis (strain ATCC 10573 / BCRC 21748 / CBS 615 / JCM 9827 / NBRC 10315 / NRRL Y-1498 / VKM Y-70) TaxID=590646 RepID=G3BBP3_CANTC|nr:uncharacterized protein CANTEDRAFT_115664 [Yamadazyma tenuis ATCC 10573]EGV62201.1 hypothetical protein CANTEDRAFT_115664 [Yamadazyma tenuis ATCC 10573]
MQHPRSLASTPTSSDSNPFWAQYETINRGTFKGYKDIRRSRCFNMGCRTSFNAPCQHCRVLPYFPSPLRQVQYPPKFDDIPGVLRSDSDSSSNYDSDSSSEYEDSVILRSGREQAGLRLGAVNAKIDSLFHHGSHDFKGIENQQFCLQPYLHLSPPQPSDKGDKEPTKYIRFPQLTQRTLERISNKLRFRRA